MNQTIHEMIEEIEEMKQKLRDEIDKQEATIQYDIHNGYISFEKEVFLKQKKNMKHLKEWFSEIPFIQFLSAPIIYGMVIPAVVLDCMLFIYTYVVSRVFKIRFVKRDAYIVFDRHYLGYLNIVEKFNCLYCAYFNGVMQYCASVAGRTELYFCPIKHAKKIAYRHDYYQHFLSYGEAEQYPEKLKSLREASLKQ